MKGTIVKCLEDLVKAKFGEAKWKDILAQAGMPASSMFLTNSVVPDANVMKLINSAAAVLKLSFVQALEAFGEFWSTKYAPGLYGIYFQRAKTAREFLLALDQVHVTMTKNAGAAPPRFKYEWIDDKHLVMTYSSPRGLVALMPGLIRGVGKYYHEQLDVSLSGNDVHVKFA